MLAITKYGKTMTTKIKKTLCPGCLIEKQNIAKSHAINNSFIKRIKTNGQYFGLPSNVSPIRSFQNGGEGKLLCFECEAEFNQKYDIYATRIFDRMVKQLTPVSGVPVKRRVKIEDAEKFCRYVASVFWRAALLDTDFYSMFKLKQSCVDDLFDIVTGKTSPFRDFTFSVRQPSFKDGPLSHDFIMSPLSYIGQTKRVKGMTEVQLMRCTILGIEILAMHGKHPGKSNRAPGIIRREKNSVFVPRFHWSKDPEYYRTIMVAMESDQKFGTPR